MATALSSRVSGPDLADDRFRLRRRVDERRRWHHLRLRFGGRGRPLRPGRRRGESHLVPDRRRWRRFFSGDIGPGRPPLVVRSPLGLRRGGLLLTPKHRPTRRPTRVADCVTVDRRWAAAVASDPAADAVAATRRRDGLSRGRIDDRVGHHGGRCRRGGDRWRRRWPSCRRRASGGGCPGQPVGLTRGGRRRCGKIIADRHEQHEQERHQAEPAHERVVGPPSVRARRMSAVVPGLGQWRIFTSLFHALEPRRPALVATFGTRAMRGRRSSAPRHDVSYGSSGTGVSSPVLSSEMQHWRASRGDGRHSGPNAADAVRSVEDHTASLAERVGFEPTDHLNDDQRLSRAPHSAALAPLQGRQSITVTAASRGCPIRRRSSSRG